jgi:hypothetical protein
MSHGESRLRPKNKDLGGDVCKGGIHQSEPGDQRFFLEENCLYYFYLYLLYDVLSWLP